MKINARWQPSHDGNAGERFQVNGITLARVWLRGVDWQVTVGLPGCGLKDNWFPTLKQAKETVEKTCEKWFDKVDA